MKGDADIFYNMDNPWGHCAKWYESVTKRQILYAFTYMRQVLRVAKIIETGSRIVFAMGWGGGVGSYCLMSIGFHC